MSWLRRNRIALRDAGVAIAIFVGFLGLMRVQFQPVQIPGYLLVLSFDAFQNPLLPGLGGIAFQAAFALYLVVLASIASLLARRLRARYGPAGRLRYGVAAALLVVGLLALTVLVAVFVPNFAGNASPLLIAAAIGVAGLWAGLRLATWRNRTDVEERA